MSKSWDTNPYLKFNMQCLRNDSSWAINKEGESFSGVMVDFFQKWCIDLSTDIPKEDDL